MQQSASSQAHQSVPQTNQPNHQTNQGNGASVEFSAGLPFQLPRGGGDQLPTLAEWNARYIEYVLNFTRGKKTAAARILGINRRTLYRRKKAESMQARDSQGTVTELPRPHEIQ